MTNTETLFMRAVVLEKPTPADEIRLSDFPIPSVQPGWVLVRIRSFGLNHSEQILRLNEIEASYIRKPIIPGIECAGEIVDPSDSEFAVGQKVIAMMGGMGRSFHGSYAEYALLPVYHVFTVKSRLSWQALGAIPETWFTAWGSLFENLRLSAGDSLLIRGATCALGYAAMQIAKALGCRVIATTNRTEKMELLTDADERVLDNGVLTGKICGATKALDLVGPRFLLDTLMAVERGGIVCQTGILGGVYALNNFDPIKDIPNGVYLTGFYSNFPTQPVVDDMFAFLEEKGIRPKTGAVFEFSQIRSAIQAQDAKTVNGKIVVTV